MDLVNEQGALRRLVLLQGRVDQFAGKTAAPSNTGPSTHTRFMAGPSGVFTSTVQPAQPPTAQAMNSSSDTWLAMPNSWARMAAALSMGVGPQAKISTSASASLSRFLSQARAR